VSQVVRTDGKGEESVESYRRVIRTVPYSRTKSTAVPYLVRTSSMGHDGHRIVVVYGR
jgi:hypothetical protein